jgi:hypothetical protein
VPAISKFDANLQKFNSTHSSCRKNIEKTVSLPTLSKSEIEDTINHAYSLRSKHDFPSSIIKCNMQFFQRKQRQRTQHIALSCPCFPIFVCPSVRQAYSLPNLPTTSNNSLRFHITPRFLLNEPEDAEHFVIDDNDNENRLFEAAIHDSIMIFNHLAEQGTTNSISLKEQADDLRHDLRKMFNFHKGRWCAEY